MLIYSQGSGRAKQLVEVIEAKDFEQDAVLDVIWGIYDNAFEKMAHERLDDVQREWEQAHRRPGQPMQDWCTYLRKQRMEVQIQDPNTVISDRSLASKMLRGSGLSQTQRAQVLWNSGGVYDSERMETVLKQEEEERNTEIDHQRMDHAVELTDAKATTHRLRPP